jgi:hypothetical protein
MYGTPLPHITQPGDRYGFVNEYQVRIAAGITLALGLYSFISIAFFAAYTAPLLFMSLLWVDFAIRVFAGPQHSPILALAAPLARRFFPTAYWVGSVQKRFAWSLGLVLITIALGCVLVTSGTLASFGIGTALYAFIQTLPHGPYMAVPFTLPMLVCVICIIFMALESLAGYCVGCHMYKFLTRKGLMRTIPHQTCTNGICQDIQF